MIGGRLVCGTGRCGTAWAAEALRRCGVRAGHEAVFGTAFHGWQDYEVDVSMAATPYAAAYPNRVVHLVRDPRAVIASLMHDRFFSDRCGCHEPGAHLLTPFAFYIRHHAPQIYDTSDELGRALRFLVAWYAPVIKAPTFRLEDITTEQAAFEEFVSDASGRRLTAFNPCELSVVNRHNDNGLTVSWAMISEHPDALPVLHLARKHGYLT